MSTTINTQGTVEMLQHTAQAIKERNEWIEQNQSSPNPQEPKKQVAQKAAKTTFSDFMRSDEVTGMMTKVLADPNKREAFTTSVISLYSQEKTLQGATKRSILQSCLKAAVLDLPIDKNLGLAWIITYRTNVGDKKNPKWEIQAQCQLGYKAFIQFALRTEKYHKINAIPIYKGQLKYFHYLTEEIDLDFSAKDSDEVIGYLGYFKLLSGFEKTVYWSKEDIERHRQRFSKQADGFGWKDNFDAMALKTVIKSMLNKWGLLTTQLQKDLKVAEEAERIDITEDAVEVEPQKQPQLN